MKTIYVFLAEGFEEVEALTPVDVLRRAGLPVKTVSITGVLTVNGAHGVPVVADMVFEEVKEEDAEMIVLPGGLPGATNLDAHEGLGKLIMTFAEAGRPLSAICAAPLVYGKRGLLKGKKVTCYPGFEKYLEGAEYTATFSAPTYFPAIANENAIAAPGPLPVIKLPSFSTKAAVYSAPSRYFSNPG